MKRNEQLIFRDVDNGKRYNLEVVEGPIPGTTQLVFGSSFRTTLSPGDAAKLITALEAHQAAG